MARVRTNPLLDALSKWANAQKRQGTLYCTRPLRGLGVHALTASKTDVDRHTLSYLSSRS
jgi:hypothetical protein